MSNQITSQLTNQDFIFNSIKIRVQGTYEEPLFCLADVCKVLNLTNARHWAVNFFILSPL